MQPGEPVLNNLGTLTEPNLRDKFAKSLPELSHQELEELIFVPVASICISDPDAKQLLHENTERLRLSSSVALAASSSSAAKLENSRERPAGGERPSSRRFDGARTQSPTKWSGSRTDHQESVSLHRDTPSAVAMAERKDLNETSMERKVPSAFAATVAVYDLVCRGRQTKGAWLW
ncbi:hypothetical protein F1559_002854 [Cyanidiococcus yangmingshanensis]|uniref:Uncharacterized protein n=1 Tax=Cyanidiococcus yangmingshanensis TaxID=2690220 RepID=A0A7J7ILQ4_9RHOD|nr:hypothetical protein F1559_002854 [Cyanidiococcus yangmingshanensis]